MIFFDVFNRKKIGAEAAPGETLLGLRLARAAWKTRRRSMTEASNDDEEELE